MRKLAGLAMFLFGAVLATALCFVFWWDGGGLWANEARGHGGAPSLKQLLAERLQCATEMLEVTKAQFSAGLADSAKVSVAMRLVLESRLDMAETKAQRVEADQSLVSMCEAQMADVENRVGAGLITSSALSYAKYDLADARVRLAKIQAEL